MPRDSDTAAKRLSEVIGHNRTEIEQRWLARVQAHVDARGVSLTNLRDGLPDYLKALTALLAENAAPDLESKAKPVWADVAREHGITRVRIGFDIDQLIEEFIVLRQVIREVAEQHGLPVHGPESVLADALDAAIAVSVRAYVDARDYLARQKQAQNIGFLTHELRNPLSNAMLAAERLRKRATPEQQQLLDMLDRNQKRLAELISGVLLTERLEAGRVESRPVEVELEQIMAPALEAARRVASQKGLQFRADYDPALRLRVDPELTRSAIQNLADNAAKYADQGHVEITVDPLPEKVVFHVRDTCEGISEEELRTIFEPFERGSSRKSGTGLGLAIAWRAVEAQGGTIQVESGEQFGCHFWFTLPR